MTTFHALLARHPFLISDGAWGTELAKMGMQAGECPELWNREKPEAILKLARSYVDAGSDIVLTNTFGGTSLKLAKSGLEAEAERLNILGVELSLEAANGRALVFGSVGPCGEFIQPLGSLSEAEAITVFEDQIRALASAGVKGIVLETFSDLNELTCAVKAARKACDLPVVACMTYNKGPRGFATMMGVTPEQAAGELETIGVDGVGANCGTGIEEIIEIAGYYAECCRHPVWVKPNAGLPEYRDGKTVYRQSMEQMVEHVPALLEAGANIVGGCCGTTPELIQAVADYRKTL